MKVSLIDLKKQYSVIKSDIDAGIKDVVTNGNFIMGKSVLDFENNISKYLGQESLSCASGSDALLLSLMACNIGVNDEVITTPFTFFATAGAIARLGAKPVFVDIDRDTMNMDVNQIESKITHKTKAIIPVHIFGLSADMDPIIRIAEKHNLKIIEDACQAIGAKYKGRVIGTLGDFGCFSFFPTKNLGAYGDGGLVTCKSETDYNLIKKIRVHGSEKKYYHDIIGINSRLDAIQAAILEVKLKYLDSWIKRRIEIAEIYSRNLSKYVHTPKVMDMEHVFHQYTIVTDDRDGLKEFLKEKDIETAVYYPLPLHLQVCFKSLGYHKGDFPNSEFACDHVLSLPMHENLKDEEVEYVIACVKEFFEK